MTTGYTLCTRFPDVARRDQMAEFLIHRDWDALRATEALGKHSDLLLGEDLPQAQGDLPLQRLLGFSASTLPHWAWGMAAWMAVKCTGPQVERTAIFLDGMPLEVIVGRDPTARERGVICTEPSGLLRHHPLDQWGIARRLGSLLLDEDWLDTPGQRRWFFDLDVAWERYCMQHGWLRASQAFAGRA